jgi:hypothetical protein
MVRGRPTIGAHLDEAHWDAARRELEGGLTSSEASAYDRHAIVHAAQVAPSGLGDRGGWWAADPIRL